VFAYGYARLLEVFACLRHVSGFFDPGQPRLFYEPAHLFVVVWVAYAETLIQPLAAQLPYAQHLCERNKDNRRQCRHLFWQQRKMRIMLCQRQQSEGEIWKFEVCSMQQTTQLHRVKGRG